MREALFPRSQSGEEEERDARGRQSNQPSHESWPPQCEEPEPGDCHAQWQCQDTRDQRATKSSEVPGSDFSRDVVK